LKKSYDYVPIGAALASFLYLFILLLRYGELLGPDECAYVAFWKETIQGDTYFEWTTPKPLYVVLFGVLYQVTHSLFMVAMVFVVAMSLLIYYGCKILIHISGNPLPCLFFVLFLTTRRYFVETAVIGGSGLLSTLFVFVALSQILTKQLFFHRLDNPIVIVSLSLAGLTRPESWVSTSCIIVCLYSLKYLRKEREGRYRDLLLLIPMLMPVLWHLFDYVAFGDLFYSTKMTQGFAENVRDAFGRSETFIWSDYPGKLKGFLFGMFGTLLLLVSLIGLVWMSIRKRRALLFLLCPFLGAILFYFVTYVREMTLGGRFFFCNFTLVVFFASIGVGAIVEFARWIPVKVLRGVAKTGIASALIFFLVFSPFRKSFSPIFQRLKNGQAVKKNVEAAVSAVMADKDFRDDSFLIVTAEHEGRICVMTPNRGSLVYPIRQLAALDGIPMFEKNLFSLMHFMAQDRTRYVYHPLEELADLEELPKFENATFFLIQMYLPRSNKVKVLIENLRKQSKSVDTLVDRNNFKVHKLKI